MKKIGKFRKGAASFYIVAISTLILVIVAASFAAVIISEVTRTSNDDLAQSAYDSALAGVEDAKLAYYNYRDCLEGGGTNCDEISRAINVANGRVEGESADCDMVADMLGRIKQEGEGVLVQEGEVGNDMQQYYTCAILRTERNDVRGELNSNNPVKVIKAKFVEDIEANDIGSIRVSWQPDDGTTNTKSVDFGKTGIFGKETPIPPVLSVGLVQTARSFELNSFDMTQGDTTNRGTLFLVPISDDSTGFDVNEKEKYNVVKDGRISKDGFLKSNNKVAKNLPYAVDCRDGSDAMYMCSVVIDLPEPVGGTRSNDTFMIVLSLPYADSSTEVSLEYICKDSVNSKCLNASHVVATESNPEPTPVARTKDTQITIDSTGRANDLYRRVETILEPEDTAYPYPLYAIQVLGDDGDGYSLIKNISPTCEWNFGDATGPKGLCENT